MKKKTALKKLIHVMKKYLWLLILSLLFSVVYVLASLYIPIFTGDAIDEIIGPGNVHMTELLSILTKIVVLIAVSAIAQYVMSLCNNRITYKTVESMRHLAMKHLQKLPLSYVDSHPQGDIISRVVSDAETMADGLLLGFSQLFTGVLTILGTLILMMTINVKIALIVVILTPLSILIAGFIAKKTHALFKKQSEKRGEQTAFMNEMISAEALVKAYGMETYAIDSFEGINEELSEVALKATFFSSLTNPSTRLVNNLVYAGVGVFGAIAAVTGSGLTVGGLSCFLSYANQYTKPFNEISGVITELQNALACAERIFELLEEPLEKEDAKDAIVLQNVSGACEITDMSFSYVPTKPLIEHMNLRVLPGQRVAIVGPTGCGKTTLINLLMRFYDVNSGTISIDGVSTQDVTRDSLRKNFGMVLQDTWIKDATVRENLLLAKPDASEDEMIEAAKAAHCHNFIMQLKDGYDTRIKDEGGLLSQGQKQLLCIARVLLAPPPMLILDEATSSIDTRTEKKVQDAFAVLMKGRTSFIVAHRLSTIQEADVILVMRDGHIVEQGTHEVLLKAGGFYANLYNSQF